MSTIKEKVAAEAQARAEWREKRAKNRKAWMSPKAREIERDLAVRNRENVTRQLGLSED